MAYVVTGSPTNITETTATLNGEIFECPEAFYVYFEFSGRSPIAVGYVENESFSVGVSGLSSGTWYFCRAKFFDGIGWSYGAFVYFQTDDVAPPPSYSRNAGGAYTTPTGSLSKQVSLPAVSRNPGSATTPSGNAAVVMVTTIAKTAGAAETTPSGAAVVSAEDLHAVDAGAAETTPSGGAAAETRTLILTSEAAGSMQPSGGASVRVVHPLPSGGFNVAGKFNLDIEQGATFSRVFAWRNASGVAVNMTGYTITVTIRPFRGSSSVIASSAGVISVTQPNGAASGKFTVSMTGANTALLDFTRAVYEIEVSDGSTDYRLVEGFVYLLRGVTD